MSGAKRLDFQSGSGRVDGATGALVGSQSGCVTHSVRIATGVYEISIDAMDPAQNTARVQVIRGNGDKITATLEWVSDSLVRVRTVRTA